MKWIQLYIPINYNNCIKIYCLKYLCILQFYYCSPEIIEIYVVIMVNKFRVYWILANKNEHCASNIQYIIQKQYYWLSITVLITVLKSCTELLKTRIEHKKYIKKYQTDTVTVDKIS